MKHILRLWPPEDDESSHVTSELKDNIEKCMAPKPQKGNIVIAKGIEVCCSDTSVKIFVVKKPLKAGSKATMEDRLLVNHPQFSLFFKV